MSIANWQVPSEAAGASQLTPHPLTLDFLAWIASEPRSYAEALEAWRTSCPRLPIWEEAFTEGLVCVERQPGVRMSEALVVLTPRGREHLGTE
jgi:hypothetical protein